MAALRAAFILIVFALATFMLLPLQWLAIKLHLPARRRIPYRYHRFVCRLFGVRLSVIGAPVKGGVLMAANHSGWLDIPILSGVAPVSFISKSEVGRWPFFGTLARLQRTVFVSRERANALQERDAIRRRLSEGDALVLFAEATSSDGNRVLPFRSALLAGAELPGSLPVPVQPVSIALVGLHGMPMGRENRPLFAWYGDMELVPHLWEALKTGPVDAIVEFHPALTVEEAGGRKQLAARAEAMVRAGLIRALSGSQSAQPAHPDEALIEALSEAETGEAA